jgi:hypothetical protein
VFGCLGVWVLVLGARSWGAGELGAGWCGQYSSGVALLASGQRPAMVLDLSHWARPREV